MVGRLGWSGGWVVGRFGVVGWLVGWGGRVVGWLGGWVVGWLGGSGLVRDEKFGSCMVES